MIRPSVDLGALAADQFKRMPAMLRYLMKGIGASEGRGVEFLSYLAFDPSYTRPLIEIGRYAVSGLSTHFQSGASLIALVGSTGFLELAAPNSSASQLLNATSGTPLVVTT